MDVTETMERLSTDRAALCEVLARYDRRRFRIFELTARSRAAGIAILGFMDKPAAETLPEAAFLLWYWCKAFGEDWGAVREVADVRPAHLAQVQRRLQQVVEAGARTVPPDTAQRKVAAHVGAIYRDFRAHDGPVGGEFREWGVAGDAPRCEAGLVPTRITESWMLEDTADAVVMIYGTETAFCYFDWWFPE